MATSYETGGGDHPRPSLTAEEKREMAVKRVHVEVFSVLMSYREPVSAYKIRKEYEEAMGYECEYQKFGFSNMDRLLQAHPDVSTLQGPNGEWLYKAMMTEKTAKLQQQVMRQRKKPKKRNKARGGRREGISYRNFNTAPLVTRSRYSMTPGGSTLTSPTYFNNRRGQSSTSTRVPAALSRHHTSTTLNSLARSFQSAATRSPSPTKSVAHSTAHRPRSSAASTFCRTMQSSFENASSVSSIAPVRRFQDKTVAPSFSASRFVQLSSSAASHRPSTTTTTKTSVVSQSTQFSNANSSSQSSFRIPVCAVASPSRPTDSSASVSSRTVISTDPSSISSQKRLSFASSGLEAVNRHLFGATRSTLSTQAIRRPSSPSPLYRSSSPTPSFINRPVVLTSALSPDPVRAAVTPPSQVPSPIIVNSLPSVSHYKRAAIKTPSPPPVEQSVGQRKRSPSPVPAASASSIARVPVSSCLTERAQAAISGSLKFSAPKATDPSVKPAAVSSTTSNGYNDIKSIMATLREENRKAANASRAATTTGGILSKWTLPPLPSFCSKSAQSKANASSTSSLQRTSATASTPPTVSPFDLSSHLNKTTINWDGSSFTTFRVPNTTISSSSSSSLSTDSEDDI